MFGSSNKLPGPREIPGLVQNHLLKEKKIEPDLARIFKAVGRQNDKGQKTFDIRIFDPEDATANKVEVKNFLSLDGHPNLIIYEGSYDEKEKKVELVQKNSLSQDVPICSLEDILQKIEGLTEPGATTWFFMARGAGSGGPLGRGAVTIELTPPPAVPGKKYKKYTIYANDVIDMKPIGKGNKLFDSDKAKEVAKWTKEGHCKRSYFG
jgi:hypothetical protein